MLDVFGRSIDENPGVSLCLCPSSVCGAFCPAPKHPDIRFTHQGLHQRLVPGPQSQQLLCLFILLF